MSAILSWGRILSCQLGEAAGRPAASDVASVAADSKDQIYVFNRGAHPMVVYQRE
ncbi:hypothetical protein [Bradyrhizobium genosp. SA-3]|uniref:hypothetical protein n=1 Tax=Bradyrhizobium genosp. SA-3 TaxID=508868 RepID=UPI0013EE974E|nr:hypothetical protein [Bradyrhizobium genosp. SA-3]